MRESQVEMKEIEAQLRSIRADRADSVPSQRVFSSTALESFPIQTVLAKQSERQTVDTRNTRIGNTRSTAAQATSTRATATQATSTQASSTRSNSPTPTRSNPTRPQQIQQNQTYPTRTQQAQPSSVAQKQAAPHSPQLPQINTNPPYQLHQTHDELAAIVERLQRQSEFYIQQVRQLQPQFAQTPEQYLGRALPVLEAQVQHINQLSAVQEAALRELKTTAEKVEQDWKVLERQTNATDLATDCNIPPLCNYLDVAVPKVEQDQHGVYVLGSRSIDLFRAEREAALTAQALRHWAERTQPAKPFKLALGKRFWRWLMKVLLFAPEAASGRGTAQSPAQTESTGDRSRFASRRTIRARRSRPRRSSKFALVLRQGVALFLSAVLVRVVLNLLLTSFPVLWTPAVALLFTPAAIAVYRTSRTPRSGLIWGYRLLFIMLGLLLGGRLL